MEMKKKEYMIPVSEVLDLRAMSAMMDGPLDLRAMSAMMDGPLFGPASVPSNPYNGAPRRKTDVF